MQGVGGPCDGSRRSGVGGCGADWSGLRADDVPAHGGATGLGGVGVGSWAPFGGERGGVVQRRMAGSPALFWQAHVLTCLYHPPNSLVR